MQRTWQLLTGALGHGARHGNSTKKQAEQGSHDQPAANGKRQLRRAYTSDDGAPSKLNAPIPSHLSTARHTDAGIAAQPVSSELGSTLRRSNTDAAVHGLLPATDNSSATLSSPTPAEHPLLLESPVGSPGQSLYYAAPPAYPPAFPMVLDTMQDRSLPSFQRLAIPYSSASPSQPCIAATLAPAKANSKDLDDSTAALQRQHVEGAYGTGPSSTSVSTPPVTGRATAAGSTIGDAGSSLLSSAVSVPFPDADVSGHSMHGVGPQLPGMALWAAGIHSHDAALPALHGVCGLPMGSIAASVGGTSVLPMGSIAASVGGTSGLPISSIAASVRGTNPWPAANNDPAQSEDRATLHGTTGVHPSATPENEPHLPPLQHMLHLPSSSLGSKSRHSCQSPTASHLNTNGALSSQAPSRQTSGSMQREGGSAARTSAASGVVADIGSLQAWNGMRRQASGNASHQQGSRGSHSHHSSSRASTVTPPSMAPTGKALVELPSLFDDVHVTAAAAAWPVQPQPPASKALHQSPAAWGPANAAGPDGSNQQSVQNWRQRAPEQMPDGHDTGMDPVAVYTKQNMACSSQQSSSRHTSCTRHDSSSQGEHAAGDRPHAPQTSSSTASHGDQFTFQANKVPTAPTPALPATVECLSSIASGNGGCPQQPPIASLPHISQQVPSDLVASFQKASHDGPQAVARLLRAFSSTDLLQSQTSAGHPHHAQAQQRRGGSHNHLPHQYQQQRGASSRSVHGGSACSSKVANRPFHSVHGGFEFFGDQPQARGTFQPTLPNINSMQQQLLSSTGTLPTQQQLQLLAMAQQLVMNQQPPDHLFSQPTNRTQTAQHGPDSGCHPQQLPAVPLTRLSKASATTHAELDSSVGRSAAAPLGGGMGSVAMSMDGTPPTQLFTQQEQGASSIEYLQNYLQVLGQGADDKHIFLTRLPLTIPALGVLSSFLSYVPAIRVISLVHASIDDDGAVELAIGLRQSYGEIWALDLRNNKIADRGAATLVGCLTACPALRELVVSHNRIGDEGLRAFTDYLASSNGVLRIRASHNPSSPEAFKALTAAYKNCRQRRSKSGVKSKPLSPAHPQQPCESSEEDALRSPAQDLIFDNILTSEDESAAPAPQPQRQLAPNRTKHGLPFSNMMITAGHGGGQLTQLGADDAEMGSVFANCTPIRRREPCVVLEDVESVCAMLRVLFAPTLPEEHHIAQDVGTALLHLPLHQDPVALSASLPPHTSASSCLPPPFHPPLSHSSSCNNLAQLGSVATQVMSVSGQACFPPSQPPQFVVAAGLQQPSLHIQPGDMMIPIIRKELLAHRSSYVHLDPQDSVSREFSQASRQSAADPSDSQRMGVLEVLASALVARGHDAAVTTSSGGGNGVDCLQNLRHSYLSVYAPRPAYGYGSTLSECDGMSTYSNAVTELYSEVCASVSGFSSHWLQDGPQQQQPQQGTALVAMSRTASQVQLGASNSAVLSCAGQCAAQGSFGSPAAGTGDACIAESSPPGSFSGAVVITSQSLACSSTPNGPLPRPVLGSNAGQKRALLKRLSRLSQAASTSALSQNVQQSADSSILPDGTHKACHTVIPGAGASKPAVCSTTGMWSLPTSRDPSTHGAQQYQNRSMHAVMQAISGSQLQGTSGSQMQGLTDISQVDMEACVLRGLPSALGDVLPNLPIAGAALPMRSSVRTGVLGSSRISRVIVDPGFREQFSVGKNSTPRYDAILAALPSVYVGLEDRLPLLVELLCEEISVVFKERGLPVPPWRKPQAIISRWKPSKSA